jgi:hypothetical protein
MSSSIEATTVADMDKPSIPNNLKAADITERNMTLSWDKSTDNIGVKVE